MTDQQTCPHCGAERSVAKIVIEFRCGTAYYGSGVCERDEDCYKRQIKQQAAEIERLKRFDNYGNPQNGDRIINCCFPDCGCDGARHCQAETGASDSALSLNVEIRFQKARGEVK